ncbi:MAG: HD domain-containing protein [Lachnospiraceae bacterium]|nr:HD domain-containing protein [Lachnospiraceae bacterium]
MSNENDHSVKIQQQIAALEQNGQFVRNHAYIQHGSISVYEHCVAVANRSCQIAEALHIHVDMTALIRGALLHDYFLYDWHEKSADHRLHGFTHPAKALRNAERDYDLSPLEQNIILRHMFPLVPIPPVCREAWIVCLADKLCASRETAVGFYNAVTNRLRLPRPHF